MIKLTAILALVMFVSSATVADARGGRTTAQDCEAGSDDPDCPDTTAPPNKSGSTNPPPSNSAPPPRK
jgi:hypothetical protein